jgi:hypothetical protein
MDAAGRGSGNEDLRFAVGKLIARAKGVDAARREKCASSKDDRKIETRSLFHEQGDVILTGRGSLVKSCVAAILANELDCGSRSKKQ